MQNLLSWDEELHTVGGMRALPHANQQPAPRGLASGAGPADGVLWALSLWPPPLGGKRSTAGDAGYSL